MEARRDAHKQYLRLLSLVLKLLSLLNLNWRLLSLLKLNWRLLSPELLRLLSPEMSDSHAGLLLRDRPLESENPGT